MRLVMAMKVRDEASVLEDNLRYHAAHGVDFFIVTDNGSTDGTTEILRRWEAAGRLRLITEDPEDFRNRAHWWVTRMGRIAGPEHGADWVLHCDADEFYSPVDGDLRTSFERIPDRYGVAVIPRSEFVARPDGPGGFEARLVARELRSTLRPKLAHRPDPQIVLRRGAHDVDWERGEDEVPRAGRPVLRGVRERDTADDERLVFAPVFPARLLHFPLRSYEQYRRRVEVMLGGGFGDKAHRKLRRAYEQDRLPQLYAELVHDDQQVEAGVAEGRLVVDERLKVALPACPDPTTAGASEDPARLPEPPSDREKERADVAFEAMRALTRTQQALIRQRDELRRRADRAAERADATQAEATAARPRGGLARLLRSRSG